MFSFLVAAFVALFVAVASGELPSVTLSGPCPTFPAQQNLDASRITGNWIGLFNKLNGIDRQQPKCVRTNLQLTPNGGVNSTIHLIRSNNQVVDKSSVGTPIGGQPGKLLFTSANHPERTIVTTVLKTDYTNFFAMVNCQSVGANHGYTVVILGRQQTLSPQLLEEAKAAITAAGITVQVEPIPETNC